MTRVFTILSFAVVLGVFLVIGTQPQQLTAEQPDASLVRALQDAQQTGGEPVETLTPTLIPTQPLRRRRSKPPATNEIVEVPPTIPIVIVEETISSPDDGHAGDRNDRTDYRTDGIDGDGDAGRSFASFEYPRFFPIDRIAARPGSHRGGSAPGRVGKSESPRLPEASPQAAFSRSAADEDVSVAAYHRRVRAR